MEKLNHDKKTLRKFGITMGIAFMAITIFILFRHRYGILPASVISLIFFISAFAMPVLLKPVYIIWMHLALVLAWVNTRLILFIIFYLIFTPTGLMVKVFRVDLLDRKIDKNKMTYWKQKEKKRFNPLDYQRQF